MSGLRTVFTVSQASEQVLREWNNDLLKWKCEMRVVDLEMCLDSFRLSPRVASFLIDTISWPDERQARDIVFILHNMRPEPNALVIVPAEDNYGYIKRFGEGHLWIQRLFVDNWYEGLDHLASTSAVERAY